MTKILGSVLIGGSILATAPGQRYPGQPTQGKVWVQNHGADEAIPVVVLRTPTDPPVPVQVAGTPTVTIAPAAIVQTRRVRQAWSYRLLTIAPGQDLLRALSSAGDDGWEAIGPPTQTAGSTVILMKRPL